ncbi:threonine-phosphate decarboxylase CobD [uncultured Roseobacter sp.]|uniref:threonine-phosphate decarboxylase CobD n=1 Tax=uncultured Roseobacter sp. TaxID=114847 RepID=UPI002613E8F5|nr:threonine-phosphate decarboxylase CobD [uncultured Roseobacter sp.]
MSTDKRDHGGGLDAAVKRWGGSRIGWIDLSTGINPHPYPIGRYDQEAWTALPDSAAQQALQDAARSFWNVPDGADVLAAPGASALIAALPGLWPADRVMIPPPTYNEHAAAFRAHGWDVQTSGDATAQVVVHPNNPDGVRWRPDTLPSRDATLTVIDESFCDVCPEASMIALAEKPGYVILKSFGKFWGCAGLRLGFAIATPETIARLRDRIGPWAVSGPALHTGTAALRDTAWAQATRLRLKQDATRLDALMTGAGATPAGKGGTDLFRLYRVEDATALQHRLAEHHIWTRTFPYSAEWIRLGLPAAIHWPRLGAALRA